MTRRDIFTRFLTESTGHARENIEPVLDLIEAMYPEWSRFDEELNAEQAEDMLQNLKEQERGLLLWFAQEAQKAAQASLRKTTPLSQN